MFHGDSGNILYDGTDITQISPESRKIGLVYQSHALFPHMKVWENIAYGLKMRGASKEEQLQTADHLMELLSITHIKNQYPGVLSGGESQRTALARALAVKPDPLLLDEPFSSLSKDVKRHMQKLVRKLYDQMHITVIYVTHNREDIQNTDARIAVMNDGSIQQIGTIGELYDNPATPYVSEFLGVAVQAVC